MSMVSDCCGAPASWAEGAVDSGICLACGEHCEYVNDEEETEEQEESNGHNQTSNRDEQNRGNRA